MSQSPFANIKSAKPCISERDPTSVEGTLPLPKQEEQAPMAKAVLRNKEVLRKDES